MNENNFIRKIQFCRAHRIVKNFGDFCCKGETVLSVGDGEGSVSLQMQNKYKVKVQGLDVGNVFSKFRINEIPLEIYDGKEIPYPDNSFDIVTAVFVLHHCYDVEQILAEIIRVSRKKIIICEDVYSTWIGKQIVCGFDYLENRSLSRDVNIPFNFKTLKEWVNLFNKLNLTVVNSIPFRASRVIPVRNQLFCLTN